MASSILKQIYGEAKTTSGAVVSMDATLKQLLTIDEKSSKKEAEHRSYEKKKDKREEQENKRNSADVTSIIRKEKRQEKKEGGGFGLGQAAILGALGVGAIGTAVGAYFISSEFREFMNEKIFVPMFQFLKNSAKEILKVGQKLLNVVQNTPENRDITESAGTALRDLTGKIFNRSEGSAVTKGLDTAKGRIDQELMNLASDVASENRAYTKEELKKVEDLKKEKKRLDGLRKEIGEKEDMEQNLRDINEEIETLETKKRVDGKLHGWKQSRLDKILKQREEYEGWIKTKIEMLNNNIEEYKDALPDTPEDKIEESFRQRMTDTELTHQTRARINTSVETEAERTARLAKVAGNTWAKGGGIFDVPGHGQGDITPMALPSGSFVLNKIATQHMFADGGMVPTLLEPGEKVFMPGDPMMGMAMEFNSAFSRFARGGFIGTPKNQLTDTGDIDANGRAIILAPAAAAAWSKMKQAGMPSNAGDVANVYRDQDEYNRLISGGYKPAPNSYHNHGEAADIHGEMNRWIRENGAQYGWMANDYTGTHGGHFEFKGKGARGLGGGGANLDPDGGSGSKEDLKPDPVSGIMGFMSEITSMLSPLTDFFGDLMGGFGDVIGSLFGGPAMTTPSNLNLSTESTPLTGDTLSMAKKIYQYVKEKGYSDAQAKGIVANIQRESSFDIGAVGDGGDSHGLFQWNTSRADRMKTALPNYATNWKGQVDYALTEHVGPNYKSDTAGMSAKDAAYWWMNKWEIPADRARGGDNHKKMNGFIDTYKFQKGGGVGKMSHSPSRLSQYTKQLEAMYNQGNTESNMEPIVIMSPPTPPVKVIERSGGMNNSVPDLSLSCTSWAACDYRKDRSLNVV